MSTAVSLIDELLAVYSSEVNILVQNTESSSIIEIDDAEMFNYNDYDSCHGYFARLLGDFANSERHFNIKQLEQLKNKLYFFVNKINSNTIKKLLNEEEIFVDDERYNDDKNNHIRPLYLFVLKMFEESKKLCDYNENKKDWIYKYNAKIYTKCQIYWNIIKLFIYNGANCNRYYEHRGNNNGNNNVYAQIIGSIEMPKDKIFRRCNKFYDITILLHILFNWKDYHTKTKEILDEYLDIIWYLIENDADINDGGSILNVCYYEQNSSQILKPAKITAYFLHSSFTSPFIDNADFHCHDITDPLHQTCSGMQCERNRDTQQQNGPNNNQNNQLLDQYIRAFTELFENDDDEDVEEKEQTEEQQINALNEKVTKNKIEEEKKNEKSKQKQLLLDARCMVRDIYCLKKLMYYGYDLIDAVKYDKKNHLLENVNTEQVLIELINTDLKKSLGEKFLAKSNKLLKYNIELAKEQRRVEQNREKWTEKRRLFMYVWILRTMGKVIRKEYYDLICNEGTLLSMLPTFEPMEIIMDYIGNNYCKKYEYLFSKIDTNYLMFNSLNSLSEITMWNLDRIISDYCFKDLSEKELQEIAYKSGLFDNVKIGNNIFQKMCHSQLFIKIYYYYLTMTDNYLQYVPSIAIVYHLMIRRRNNDDICILYGEAIYKAKPALNGYFNSYLMLFRHIGSLDDSNKEKEELMRKLLLIYQPTYIMSKERNNDERMQKLLFRLMKQKEYVLLKLLMKYKVLNVMCLLNELKLLKECLLNFGINDQNEFLDEFLYYLFKNINKDKKYRRNVAWLRKLCRDNIDFYPKNNRTDAIKKAIKIFEKYSKKKTKK